MPYPRPVSPVSLETCVPSSSELDPDDLFASDDELDDIARAAKRQRIEKLAESHLQGKPLFILSASLRGPLNDGWKNPWKKNRTHGAGTSARILSNRKTNIPERVVQETDLRAPKYREGLSVGGHRPEIPATSFNSPMSSVQAEARSSPAKSSRRQSKEPTPCTGPGGQNGTLRRSSTKLKEPQSRETPSSVVEDQSIIPPRTAEWLKKDRRLMNFTKFEPPSSPTISVASRQSDKIRRPMLRPVQVQVPQTPASPVKYPPIKTVPAKTAQSVRANSSKHLSPRSTSAASSSPKAPGMPKLSPFQQYQRSHLPLESSLRIVNSSSQLPRFEYRRWLRQNSSQQEKNSPMHDESILQEETFLQEDSPLKEKSIINPASVRSSPARAQDQALDPAEPTPLAPEEVAVSNEDSTTKDKSQKTLSKETRFADEEVLIEDNVAAEEVAREDGDVTEEETATEDAENEDDTSTFQNTAPSAPTEQNTYNDLPSAQQVPAPLGLSDRVISLHSTALPKENSGQDSPPSPDTQLSTQAALLHAQKSFQDDLDSPEYYKQHTPNPDRIVHSPNASLHSANFTPFYRLEESIRRDLERSSRSMNKDGMHAMSTQFMLDAATPFNFSTEQAGHDRSLKPTNRNMTQPMNTQFILDAATPYVFSTEKRQRASRPDSGSPTTRDSKRKRMANIGSPCPSTRSQPTSPNNEYHTAESQSGEDEDSPQSVAQQLDHQQTYQSATEGASLPLNLSESAPTTGQDGQGVHQGMETFNLSQAIADAGSWLQQSFDFMKDTGQSSQNLKVIPTSGVQCASSPLNMDLSQ
ncbi:uncharacterized protein N7479_011265 [Penicillium vulpinum]|uniref:Uncharacterized protein n=1 Tax=Penicillium vulpinum TaxID=29845 RepID=A0A1V6RY21_9EURO|nr:uncharacterized protein N7479_011265 [Penicillium vulpinum]KAJ5952852.1 hypothetical protein N7479_011265 [Penicillium vulpinum]OQE06488.1 hypothetical protein PENVUL_c018G05602 [Penicillium vulpinum]